MASIRLLPIRVISNLEQAIAYLKSLVQELNAWYSIAHVGRVGSITVTGAATTGTVTLSPAEPSTSYNVFLTPVSSAGAPTAGSNRVIQPLTKNVGSFVFTVEAAPGVGTSVTFDWLLVRQ